MASRPMTDFFDVLGLSPACEVDLHLLEQRYRALQQEWHPDRKATASATERSAALQRTSLINDAYDTLKSPLKRAAHLLELQGLNVATHQQSQLAPAFLFEQMELHDRLEDLAKGGKLPEVEAMRSDATQRFKTLWQAFTQQFNEGASEQAQRLYFELQFMQRFIEAARAVEDRLLGY